MRNKILSLLVLLLTAASGAWAADGVKLTTAELVPTAAWNGNYTDLALSDMPGLTADGITEEQAKAWADVPKFGAVDLIYGYVEHETYMDFKVITFTNGVFVSSLTIGRTYDDVYYNFNTVNLKTYYATGVAEPPLTVAWNASTKTGTFEMPSSDVVLTPQYAPAAKWDVVENVEQLPAALEGIIAGQDAAIVTPGQSAQGTPMYAVTPTAEAAPALTAFSATVPTAKTYDDATTLYVWYYIQGQDTPDGQQATEENTFNDSEISATPLKVDILTNKFDLTLKPAPVKNMTVTVAGQAKTPTDEGKVEAVKMQSEVKLKAATGYKFRKVEVKKGGAATLATALENGATVVIAFKYRDDGTCTFTNNNGTFTFVSGTGQLGGGNGPKQLSVENGKLIFKGSVTNSFTDRWSWYGFQVTFDPTANTYEVWKGSDLDVASFTSISVNGTDITDQLSELK